MKQKYLLLMSIFICGFIAYKLYIYEKQKKSFPVVQASFDKKNINQLQSDRDLPQDELAPKEKDNADVFLRPDEFSAIENWRADHGLFARDALTVYQTYSEVTLKQLAQNGDLRALDVLATRAMSRGDDAAVKAYYDMSIVYGSTAALTLLSTYIMGSGSDVPEGDRKSLTMKALALARMAGIRGDRREAQVSRDGIMQIYKLQYKEDLILSEQDKTQIDALAREFYKKYQDMRTQKGLGDFNNEEPSGLKKILDYMYGSNSSEK